MTGQRPLKVIVAGGSISGLCAGIALRGIGCEVEVYERTPGAMASRGAGIVVQEDLRHLLRAHGAPVLPVTACRRRLYLLPEGGAGVDEPLPQEFTSWQAIYRTLRATFPDAHYHPGSTFTGFDGSDGAVVARFAEHGAVEADLLVCADGSHSATRRRLLPDTEPRYAGYVAWRGTVEEERAPPGLFAFFEDSLAFCEARWGGHILAYVIPGHDAATAPGRRSLNWVWYVKVPDGPAVARLLLDRNGEAHAASVPAGLVPDAIAEELRAAAAREVHPRFAELVRATAEPFIQIVLDVAVPRMAFGRACLVGDAAFVLRPHAAAASGRAAADATALAAALAAAPRDVEAALHAWEKRQLAHGRALVDLAGRLGRRSVDPHEPARSPAEAAERFGPIALPLPLAS